jgi:peptidoglycan L-alanyl-D-glutamate endopeptidase CwlK
MNSASLARLKTCHPKLITLILRLDEVYPVHVVCGVRTLEDQKLAFESGNSKLPPGKSKHNIVPSHAVDIVPDPDRSPKTISWADLLPFQIMCYAVEAVAKEQGIKIRLGRDFSFKDWPHVELMDG